MKGISSGVVGNLDQERQIAVRLARETGVLLLKHLQAGVEVEHKTSKDDPVTIADREASALIIEGLQKAFPEDGLLSEEETDSAARLQHQRVWIIDPIDGTREFTEGKPDFCISIGLCIDGEPVLGVIYAPTTDELWSGVLGQGVEKNGQTVELDSKLGQNQDPVVSVSDTEHRVELGAMKAAWMQPSGSTALKLARVSSGETNATFTMSPRSEWDLAGGHALVRAAGGEVRRRDGQHIVYNQSNPTIEQGFIGGHLETLQWLEQQLKELAVPITHLCIKEDQPAWTWVNPESLSDGELCIRYNHHGILALMVINSAQRSILQVQGDAFHLGRLTRDVIRAFGPMQEA